MFHQTSIEPKLIEAEFIRITSDNLDVCDLLQNEDKTNATFCDRTIDEYNSGLAIDLVEVCKRVSKLAGRKITLLDAGCGRCVAIKELLSNRELQEYVGCITGISMNYFSNVKRVARLHGDRFVFYYGKAQDVLSARDETYDLIIDSCGAYYYSADKVRVLELYHQSLNPGGEAHVVHRNHDVHIAGQSKNLNSYISQKHPKTFVQSSNNSVMMKKSSRHFPLPAMRVTLFTESSVRSRNGLTLKKAREGNAVAPEVVMYELMDPSKKKRLKL